MAHPPWPLPQSTSAAVSGVRTQWTASHGGFPGLLEVLGAAPHWLVAVCRARAAARTDRARDLFERFEAELATATGHAAVSWPAAWGVVLTRHAHRPRAEQPELGRLDPAQALLIGGGATVMHLPCARMLKVLLEAAFSPASPDRPVGDETRARILTACLPEELAPRWRSGLGLEPPAVLVPEVVREATTLLSALRSPAPVDLAGVRALGYSAVVDFVCTAATIRASLQAAADDASAGRRVAA